MTFQTKGKFSRVQKNDKGREFDECAKHPRKAIGYFVFKVILLLFGTYLSVIFNLQSVVFFVQAFSGNRGRALTCILVVTMFVFAGLLLLLFKYRILERIKRRLIKNSFFTQVVMLLFSMLCAGTYIVQFYNNANVNASYLNYVDSWWFHLSHIFGFAAEPSAFTLPQSLLSLILFVPLTVFYLFFMLSFADVIKSVLTTLSLTERNFLIIASAISVVYIIVLYNSSSVYYGGLDRIYSYDSLPDSSYLINPFYYWSYYQYPLEPNFSMPVMMMANLFIPPVFLWQTIARTAIQFLLLLVVIVMLSRMISENPRVRLFTLLLFTFSFPTLILAPITERRVITLIFLVIAIYQSMREKEDEIYWLSIASGGVICNAYLPFMLVRAKKDVSPKDNSAKNNLQKGSSIKNIIKKLVGCGGAFLICSRKLTILRVAAGLMRD